MLASVVLTIVVSHAAIAPAGSIQSGATRQPPEATKPAAPEKPWPPAGVVRAGKEIAHPRLIREVKPGYPADAKRAKIQGMVTMEAVVEADGKVGEVRVSRSLDKQFGLDDEAVKTVKKWLFEPAKKDGVAVPVLVEVEMSFTLLR